MDTNAAQAYHTQQIMTASPAELVAMLYDRAIANLNAAIQAIAGGDIEGRWRNNSKAMEVISHLAMTLDLERGGLTAENLDQLYRFMLGKLPLVDSRNDAKPAKEVVALLVPLRDSWREIAKYGDTRAPGTNTNTRTREETLGGLQVSA